MVKDQPAELSERVETIVNEVANHDAEHATQLLNELMSEYGTSTIAAVLLAASSDSINAVRAGPSEIGTQTDNSDARPKPPNQGS